MNRIVLGSLAAALSFVSIKVPVAGIVALEREFEVYPVVSQETVASMDELSAAAAEFDRACYCYKSGAGASLNGKSCEGVASEFALDEAKDHRKAAAAKLDPNLLTAIVLGVNYHTHSTWKCSGSSHDPKVDIDLGLFPTYDPT